MQKGLPHFPHTGRFSKNDLLLDTDSATRNESLNVGKVPAVVHTQNGRVDILLRNHVLSKGPNDGHDFINKVEIVEQRIKGLGTGAA